MILLGGLGKKSKKIADAGLMKCKSCNNMATFEIREISNTASMFFIPVAKWNKISYLVCSVCSNGYELPEESKNKLLEELIMLPSNEVSTLIWNDLDKLLSNFLDDKKNIEKWNEFAIKTLKQKYKEDDLIYVISCFNKNLLDSVNKK